jgi:hypothetical protein
MRGLACVALAWPVSAITGTGRNNAYHHGVFVMPIINGKCHMRSVKFIGGPLDKQETVADASDWKVIEDNGRLWFYLWDAVADTYTLDGSITGTRQTAVKLSQVLWQQPTPLHSPNGRTIKERRR